MAGRPAMASEMQSEKGKALQAERTRLHLKADILQARADRCPHRISPPSPSSMLREWGAPPNKEPGFQDTFCACPSKGL